jgi:Flagellar biosynthesis/type III secretory pathway protein
MKSALKSSEEIKQKSEELGYKEGYAMGYDEGLKQGIEEGQQEGRRAAAAEVELGLQEIKEVIECMNQERQAALESQEEDLLAIAFEISRKIMRQQIQEDNDVFLKIFDEVIHGDDVGLKIYLSESQKTIDFHVTKEIVEKIKKLSNKSKVIIMKEDDKIMVETDDAVIDMSLPVQLKQLNKTIQENS